MKSNPGMALAAIVAVLVACAGDPQASTADGLAGTSWRLVKFVGGDDTTRVPEDPDRYTLAFESGGRVAVRVDCNRGAGSWQSSAPAQLQFGPLALTRAMCPPGSLHDLLVRQWPHVRSYLIRNGHLHLSLMADGGTFEFEPLK
jgi:para-nitrobenzyl esterase